MSEENKLLATKFYEMFNTGDLSALDSVLATDAVDHEVIPGTGGTAREMFSGFVEVFRTAFPDLQVTVEDMVADGDMVAVRFTTRGTHQGEFMGMPATGRKVEVGGFDLMRFANGQAVEHWGLSDNMTMMQQLGVIPSA